MTFRSAPRALATATAALLALTGVTACSNDDSPAGADPQRVDVVAGFYPLQFLAERIGGDAVAVTNLARPGAEPHDLELNPGQVGQISEAELVLFLHGFQPAVDEAVEQQAGDRAFDVATVEPLLDATAGGHDHGHEGEEDQHGHEDEEHAEEEQHAEEASDGAKDPHVWLDPIRLATIGDKLAERLGTADPDRADEYTQRAATLRTELEQLDTEFAEGLKTCQRREIVVSHTAFGYLAQKYQLEQIGISGLTPEDEPSPQRLAAVAEEAREHQATTIFFETLVSPKVAETIAREVGAQTAVLDPIEGLSAEGDGDYLSVMRTNLQTLRTALSCS
ncbi:metal ABC transporter substrate-binding protein [Micromonospora sediminimaris]|uniref:Zinc ABC transporter substrate-binding protein n=1 Tax=Micromonospora sediminimaris TaxID=547162 RepID=A0A9W5UWA3_9ACTN|nr:metal ABC transporter substrate-binding protein [Micromonospora sediminimaris]GIJ35533.1 zinc ABC transporter substrate-binding protein [Micromonospora sediminimaris]SFD23881.1 zinc transport system substrate-binding protein [Micromonospora sediminimaris]